MKKLTFKHTILASYGGYISQAINNNLAPLLFVIFNEQLGISYNKITLLITVNFFMQLFVDFVAARFVDKIGYKPCIVAAHLFCGTGLACMSIFPLIFENAFGALIASVIIYAVGGGLIEVLISPIVEACPTDNKSGSMSLLHSFYCWGCVGVILLTTLFFAVFGKSNWQILPIMWSLFPFANAILFSQVPVLHLTEKGEGLSPKKLFNTKVFWLFVVLMLMAGATEQCLSQWASAFAESGLGVSKTVGDLLGPCMFCTLMGAARVVYAKVSEKIDVATALIISSFICVTSYAMAGFSSNAVVALLGCALCGIGSGILWPAVFSLASATIKNGGTVMFAYLALAGDLGCLSGPTVVGMVAGDAGDKLNVGFAVAMVFPAIMILGCVAYKKLKKIDKDLT